MSSNNIQQVMMEVEQLRKELSIKRLLVSKAVEDIKVKIKQVLTDAEDWCPSKKII